MKRKKSENRRTFLFSLGLSLFLLITSLGLAAVDYEGRKLSFGDDTPPIRKVDKLGGRTELEWDLFGMEAEVDITGLDKFLDFLCDFSCIPHK